MSIEKEQVRKIANLAKLSLTEEELDEQSGNLSRILDYVATLSEMNTKNIQPLTGPLDLANVVSEDEPLASSKELLESMIANLPDKEEIQEGVGIKVPKMVSSN